MSSTTEINFGVVNVAGVRVELDAAALVSRTSDSRASLGSVGRV